MLASEIFFGIKTNVPRERAHSKPRPKLTFFEKKIIDDLNQNANTEMDVLFIFDFASKLHHIDEQYGQWPMCIRTDWANWNRKDFFVFLLSSAFVLIWLWMRWSFISSRNSMRKSRKKNHREKIRMSIVGCSPPFGCKLFLKSVGSVDACEKWRQLNAKQRREKKKRHGIHFCRRSATVWLDNGYVGPERKYAKNAVYLTQAQNDTDIFLTASRPHAESDRKRVVIRFFFSSFLFVLFWCSANPPIKFVSRDLVWK